MILQILDNANYKAYKYGASYFLELIFLSKEIYNWKYFKTHEKFLSEIRQKHYRKKSFWSLCGII